MQKNLEKSYLEQLFNSTPEAIVWHDKNDMVLNINVEFTKLFGYTRQEAIGKTINSLVAPDHLVDEAAKLSKTVINGNRVEFESKRRTKNGRLIDVLILGAPIFHEGEQMGVYAIYRDITERKKAEEELIIQKTYLERLFNSAPEAIVLHGNNDLILDVNDEFIKIFGYSRDEAIGKPINDLLASEDFEEESKKISENVIGGEKIDIETKRKRKDGSLIDVSILGAPIIHEGRQIGDYAIYRDISDRKKAEETRARFREESRMAHDIQKKLLPQSNPAILGYDIAGKNIPALNVGGDYFDFIELDEYRVAIALGDVSGKGLAASLVMANLQATIRGQAYYNLAVNKCLERANNLLFQSTNSKTFISLFYGILDTKSHTLTYSNAGQNMPYIFTKGKNTVSLKTRGIALSMKSDVSYNIEKLPLSSGDIIVIYSDGISEAMNKRMTEFGDKRIKMIVKSNIDNSANILIDKIFSSVNKHFGGASQNDDMTMIVLRRK